MSAREKKGESKSEREKRLAAELRANLARRKAQARSRRAGETGKGDDRQPATGKSKQP